MTPSLTELLDFHTRANIGVFGSALISLRDGLKYSIGATGIEDEYWNYAFTSSGNMPSVADIHEIINFTALRGSQPYFLTFDNCLKVNGASCRLSAKESWMLKYLPEQRERPIKRNGMAYASFVAVPTEEMVSIFVDAYGESEGSVGYSGLPEPYVAAYREQTPGDGFSSTHACLYDTDGSPVAVASALYNDAIVGVYSVGVKHAFRQRGYGKLCTSMIIEHVRSLAGVNWAFLQTEAESPVESLYSGLGFERVATAFIYEICSEL